MMWEVVELITAHGPSGFYSSTMRVNACSPHSRSLGVCNSSLIFQTVPWAALTAVAAKRYFLSPLSSWPGGGWEHELKSMEP